jgi:hypothetical protein
MATNIDKRVPTLLTQLNLHESSETPRPPPPPPIPSASDNDATTPNTEDPNDTVGTGTYQKQKIAMPKMDDNGLNRAMAEAAAIKYEKDKVKIQKACAKIDNPTPPKQNGLCCIIL